MSNALPAATPSQADTRALSDAKVLQRIHRIMDGTEWDADTLEAIAEVLRESGRTITEPEFIEHDREKLITLLREDFTNDIVANGSIALNPILNEGFEGLENMPYSQLLDLATDANLLDRDAGEDDDEDQDD